MTETGKLVSRIPLANGLILEIWDLSQPVIADRWQVTMEARVHIPVTEACLEESRYDQLPELQAVLGSEVCFRQQKTRNFIEAGEVRRTFAGLTSRFIENAQAYLGHRDFPRKFIWKKFTEYQEKQSWYQPDESAD